MPNDKILILYSNYGDGHLQAAKAIRDSFCQKQPDMEVILVDFMELTRPYIHPLSRFLYLQGVQRLPSAYGYLYDKTRSFNHLSSFLKKFNRIGMGRLLKLLQTLRPSAVVSTFPAASGAMSILRSYGLTDTPVTTVITDHTDHSYWVYPYTNQYIVGSEFVRQGLLNYHISEDQITVTGIPIRLEFSNVYNRSEIARKHGLDSKLPTLLLMGGGGGFICGSPALVKALEAIPMRIQLIFVCGHNDKLQEKLREKLAFSKHLIHITGYIDHVHELMSFSDMMISKPGGLTISEALAMELPMIIFNPLPGQEEDNTKFLLKAGAAFLAESVQGLTEIIGEGLQHPELLASVRKKTRTIQKKWAALDAQYVICQSRFDYVRDKKTKHFSSSWQY
jgi:processive 1,2-diacylglycerol beta-glucosyltransferase